MPWKAALLAAGCFFASLLVGCREPESGAVPVQEGVDVLEYDIRIRLDPVTQYIQARVRLDVLHPDTLRTLLLALHPSMSVDRVRVNDARVRFGHANNLVRLALPEGERALVEIVYRGFAKEGVLLGEGAGQRVVYTQSWPQEGTGWLPGIHHPSDPARFKLDLIVPKRYSVAASGQMTETIVNSDSSWTTHSFVLDEAAPTYSFAFAVSDSFVVREDATASGIQIRHHLLAADASQANLLARTPAILDTLQRMLGPYPFRSYATVEVPMIYAGMENAAASFLSADLYRSSAGHRNLLEAVNIHEAVHQWFGNDIVPADWADLWIAEGFATYLTTVVVERLDGEAEAAIERANMAALSEQDGRRRLVPEAYTDPAQLLTATVYQKGGSVLHLLRLTVGDELFFSALRRLAEDFADMPLSTASVQSVFEDESGRDFGTFFSFWVYGETVPSLITEWDRRERRLSWRVAEDGGLLSEIPVEVLVEQNGASRIVDLSRGSVVLTGTARPRVRPIGVVMEVHD